MLLTREFAHDPLSYSMVSCILATKPVFVDRCAELKIARATACLFEFQCARLPQKQETVRAP